ncbi:hypothetical protein Btru_051516 [Bulinus truncatus]|nr:hypothetical protein Btru_051516 [Bulinus truncatus]
MAADMGTPRRNKKNAFLKHEDSEEDSVDQDDNEHYDPSYSPNKSFSPGHSEKSYSAEENTSKSSHESSPHNLRSRTKTSPSPSSSTASPRNELYPKLPSTPLYPQLDKSYDSETTPCRIQKCDLNNSNRKEVIRPESYIPQCRDNTSKSKKETTNSFYVLPFFVIFAIFAFIIYLLIRPNSSKSNTNLTPFSKYVSDIDILTLKLPNQKKRLWSTVKASVLHILNESHSDYPSVILMASPSETFHIALCVAKQITEKFESANGKSPKSTVVDIDWLKHLNAVEQKKQLDENLRAVFQTSKSVVINNLQMLSPEAALLLHAYCDNDNAPHKDIMIVLMYYTDAAIHKLDPDRPNNVEYYLEEQWSKELHVDKVSALMSRVANNIVVVNEEDAANVNSVCSNG